MAKTWSNSSSSFSTCYLQAMVSLLEPKCSRSNKKVIMKSTHSHVLLNKMIIMNYPIAPLGILHLPNITSKQDPHSLSQNNMSIHPMLDNHSPWPISTTQGDHSWQPWHMSMHPTGIDSIWPIVATQDDHYRQQGSMSLHSMGIDLPCTIAAIQDDHSWQHFCMS